MSFGQDASFRLEQPVGSMSISPCGRDVVLASREGLHIIDLDSPYSPPRYLLHHTPWEVADVQWSPFASRDYWVVSTSNQKALIWNLEAKSWQDSIESVLHAHTRAITDINFSAHHPDILATCAVDSFIHCWDLRAHARPAYSFSDWFAGATQVKWSRQDPHVLASSHDRFLRVWDNRKGAYPLHTIEAHDTKIYGLDWNRFEPDKIVTCSLDRSIKFWRLGEHEHGPDRVIRTPFPVWRARHTPFGWGLLAMPQRSDYDLHLYDRRVDVSHDRPDYPEVKNFPGHKGQVKEFLWRAQGPVIDGVDHREFQLVTWGTDKQLILHKVDRDVLLGIGYEKGVTQHRRLNITRRGATYKTFRDEPIDASPTDTVFKREVSLLSNQSQQLRPRGSTSVGMSKVSLPHFRGWVESTRRPNRTGMHGRARPRQNLSPIAWMKNVRINTWDQETLADEVTQVGDRFKKVDFEEVEVQHGRAVVSLQAPWGDESAPIFVRVVMKFPKLYPRAAPARFTVQKTASMDETLIEKLSDEMHTIAETFAKRRKGCIEAVLRYLLRDQTLDQAISLVLDDTLADPNMFSASTLSGELSSDSDDDQIQAPPDMLNTSNANVRVPLAKACGALWSDSGKLICFFPPKPVRPAVVDAVELQGLDQSRSTRLFEGFGRLHTGFPGPRTTNGTYGTKTTDDETLSMSSDSSRSRSDSSGSSDERGMAGSNLLPRKAWQRGLGFLRRTHSAERSSRSVNGLVSATVTDLTRENVVSIHDSSNLIPSEPKLAMGYRIFGYGPEVCDHNAEVADKENRIVIATVWRLAKLILENNVPLRCFQDPATSRNIIAIARRSEQGLSRTDSGIDLSYDAQAADENAGRVRWGNSPLGPAYLIPALFEHYEALGDVQMLAMMSCVFAEPKSSHPETLLAPHKEQDLSIELKAPAFSVDYYPSLQVARSIGSLTSDVAIQVSNGAVLMSQPICAIGSGSSEAVQLEDNRTVVGPFAEADPLSTRTSRRPSQATSIGGRELATGNSSTTHSVAVSLSTSPEDTRTSKGSSTNLQYSFSKATLQQLYSHSPPTANEIAGRSVHKSGSPSGSVVPSAWSASTFFNATSGSRGSRTSQQASAASSDEQKLGHLLTSASFSNLRGARHDRHEIPDNHKVDMGAARTGQAATRKDTAKAGGKRKRTVRTTLHNQTKFDMDGYASLPLLDPELEWKFKAYRANYAHLLGVWQLYPQMAEVLKFDGLVSYFAAEHDGDDSWSLTNTRRRKTMTEQSRAELADKKGVEIRRCCRDCSHALAAIEKNGIPIGWHCTTTACPAAMSRTASHEMCTICSQVIRGVMVPCLHCGHVTCYTCAQGWFADAVQQAADNEEVPTGNPCPSGCGCYCSTYDTVSLPIPTEVGLEDEPVNPVSRRESPVSYRSDRIMSEHGPDTAIGAFLSLTRTRSISAAKESILRDRSAQHSPGLYLEADTGAADGDPGLDPWPSGRFASLGRGYGGGLSRGLSARSSDATIRKVDG